MAVKSDAYVEQIKNLLPHGLAWDRDDAASVMALMIECWAMEFSRIDARVEQLLKEADPRFCSETFQEWLTQWGVPDECLELWGEILAGKLTQNMLREALVRKVRTVGGQSIKYFVELAETYGYTIHISEYRPFTVQSRVTDDFTSEPDIYHRFKVDVYTGAGGKVYYFDAQGQCDEPLSWWGDKIIECLLRRYAPAHTEMVIGYIAR